MHRIDTPSATTEKKFTEGSPSGGVAATVVSADWLNDVQENICYVIEQRGFTLVKGDKTQLLQAILSAVQPVTPTGADIGQISAFGQANPPSGWIKCNGAAISRTVYANLFAAIGVTFGTGNGSTTFNVPDLRGEFVRGLDDGRGVDGSRQIGSSQGHQFQTHAHGAVGSILNGAVATNAGQAGRNSVVSYADPAGTAKVNTTAPLNGTSGSETRPRNVALPYFIKF